MLALDEPLLLDLPAMVHKHLVIVESPAKAKTINKYLGKDFIVKSSIGHIRDLPVSKGRASGKISKKQQGASVVKQSVEKSSVEKLSPQQKAQARLFEKMGINPEKGWQANYAILPGKEKVVQELRALARTSDMVYLATDLDREGEAIAWHLQEILKKDQTNFARVTFNEITKHAIQQAFQQPGSINTHRVHAQQTRRFLDRIVGYMLSPLLWEKIARGLSAGRVQSVAVRLIVEREEAIRSFIAEEYWQIFADLLTPEQQHINCEVIKYQDKKFKAENQQQTEQAVHSLQNATYIVESREDKPIKKFPNPPFITSTLQQPEKCCCPC